MGGYTLKEGLPVISLKVERRKGGVQLSCTPALSGVDVYKRQLLLQDAEKNPPAPEKKPESIPGVQRGGAGWSTEPRKDSYSAGLDMLFGRKWREMCIRDRQKAAASALVKNKLRPPKVSSTGSTRCV